MEVASRTLLIVLFFLWVVPVVLEVFLARTRSPIPGLVLPVLSFLLSLIPVLSVAAYGGIWQVIGTMVMTLLIGNIMTLILLAIFLPLSTTVNMPVFKSDISFGLAEVPIGIMLMILCGLCTSVMWGNIFNLAVEGLGKYTAAASGIFMVMVCGGGVLPLIQGAVADGFGYLASFWVIIVALAYILYYAQVGSKNVNKDIPVE